MDGLVAYALAKKYADAVGQQVLSAGFKVQVEQDRSVLNGAGQEKIMYFLPKTVGSTNDGYDEFIYAQNVWEWVGKTDVDLSGYALKTEVGNLENLSTTEKASLVAAINELFQSVSNGKTLVASAITDKGVSTSSDATFSIMAQNIEAIPTGSPTVLSPALVLWDWEGTKLAEYSAEDALTLTELPAPSTLPAYATADHDLLLFQSWNWSLANIKTWIQNHEGECLDVGAIYTTTDGLNHNYWGNPRLNTATIINMHKRGTASIGIYEFQDYHVLTRVNIPDGVTSIGLRAFNNCNHLAHVNIPDGVTNIEYEAFKNCFLAQINIPNSITSIGVFAFQSCSSLTRIDIPDGVTSIVNGVFYNCTGMTSVTIPDSVTSIGSKAFQSCISLTRINIPDGVTNIGDAAFADCTTLCDILLESKPTLSDTNAFKGLPTNYRIYVPRADLSWFETATNWSTIYTQSHIVAIEDYIEYLESLGFDVNKYKGATA